MYVGDSNLEPWLHQASFTELASANTVDGLSTERVARLLLGEHALFIPAAELPVLDEEIQPQGNGLRLNEVDDVLWRFGYLSVAR